MVTLGLPRDKLPNYIGIDGNEMCLQILWVNKTKVLLQKYLHNILQ